MDMDMDMALTWNNILFILFSLLLVQSNVWAKEVDIQPSISTRLGYSDNIDLDATNEKDDFFLRVTPAISFKREGARVKSNLNYSLSGLLYASESDDNEIQHRLAANAASEIIKHSFFQAECKCRHWQELVQP